MYKYFNPNPCGRAVGDCAVRAISAAFDVSWEKAFDAITKNAKQMCDMPSSDSVWGALLRQFGFEREMVQGYTVSMFAKDHPRGVYVLGLGGHVVTVVDGDWMDSWDSGNCEVIYVWKRERRSR